jgi:hypothetical protein
MEAKKRKERSDYQEHLAQAILSIALKTNTSRYDPDQQGSSWKEISDYIGISKRATYDLLRDMESRGVIRADRKKSVQDHNTMKVNFSLTDDLKSFAFYVDLFWKVSPDMLKKFMMTEYYRKASWKMSEIISSHAEIPLVVVRLENPSKYLEYETVPIENAIKIGTVLLSSLLNPSGNSELLEEAETLEKELWLISSYNLNSHASLEDTAQNQFPHPPPMPKNMNHERSSFPLPTKVAVRLLFPMYSAGNARVEIREPNEQIRNIIIEPDEDIILFEEKENFIPDCIDITRAAFNDEKLGFVIWKLLVSFPSSAATISSLLLEMIDDVMPSGYNPMNIDYIFDPTKYSNPGVLANIFREKWSSFFIAGGDIPELLLFIGLLSMNPTNAIIPRRILSEYLLEDAL